MSGADVAALSALASTFGDAAEQLTRIRSAVVVGLNTVYWEGPDALAVRDDCRRSWEPMLDRAAELLAECQVVLQQQVRQQLEASGGGSSVARTGAAGYPVMTPASTVNAWADAVSRSGDAIVHAWDQSGPPEAPDLGAADEPGSDVTREARLDEFVAPPNAAPADPTDPWLHPRAGDGHWDWLSWSGTATDEPPGAP